MSNILINNGIEIYKDSSKSTTINVFNDELRDFNINDNTTYHLKGKFNNKYVKLTTENIDNEEKLLDTLKYQSSIIDNDDESSFAVESILCDRCNNDDISYDDIINFFKSLIKYKEKYSKLFSINSYFSENKVDISIENSNVLSKDNFSLYNFYIEVIMRDNDKSYDEFIYIVNKEIDFNKIEEKLVLKLNELENRFNNKNILTNKYNVIINNDVVSKLLSPFLDMFNAYQIKNNISVLKNKYNTKIFSDKITMIEDPTNNELLGTRLFDNEGTKTYKKTIVDKGVFITKLYNNQSAKLENTNSTGNSFGVRNLFIESGNNSYTELKNKLSNGIIITNVEGTHSGIDTKSGDISVQARGILINNGKEEYIESMILSTNLFDLFSNVLEIGNDLLFNSSSLGTPSILFENILIVGKE